MAVPAALALVAFGVYAALAPGVSGLGDGAEFTLVLATAGAAHPTGYPLYTLAGHLWSVTLHAAGLSWARAANLFSAAGAAVAIGLLQALAARLGGAVVPGGPRTSAVAAALAAGLFAFLPAWIVEATVAEVYTWHVAWACATAFVFAGLLERCAGAGGRAASWRDAVLWGSLCGLGLAHHVTSVLVSVPLTAGLAWALARRGGPAPRLVAIAAASSVLPLLAYGWIAWRAFHPGAWSWPDLEPSLAGVWRHVTGARYRHFAGTFAPSAAESRMLAAWVYPALAAGAIAWLLVAARAGARHVRIAAWSLLAAVAAVAGFGFRYGVYDAVPYFLPAVALSLAALAPAAALLFAPGRRVPARPAAAVAGLLLVAFVAGAGVRAAGAERHRARDFESLVRSMWAAVPDGPAIVLWPGDEWPRLPAYQLLRGEKPRLFATHPQLLMDPIARLRFRRRFGFDPLAGVPVPSLRPGDPGNERAIAAFQLRFARAIAARAPVPVILFDPTVPVVRELEGRAK